MMDVATGEDRRRPDRPGALLAHRLAAGREVYYYVRRLPADQIARGRGAVPPPGLAAPLGTIPMTTYDFR